MRVHLDKIKLPAAELGPNNPLPYLCDTTRNKTLKSDALLPNEKEGLGFETSYRSLPYLVQDGYRREKRIREIKTIVAENSCLRATFLPEYGGRLWSLFDKTRNKELLYVNPVFQPCNLAVRNAWFSGGIEWNLGQYGHSALTCENVFFARGKGENGLKFLRMYEYERIKGLFMQIDFYLPDDEPHLYAHVNIYNRNAAPASLYWWTNIAVEQTRRLRVLSGTSEVIASLPEDGRYDALAHETMPHLSHLKYLDASYPGTFPYSSEYFFQNPPAIKYTWEAAAYDDGTAFYERSTPALRYRKMFCWSSRRGGEHWQEFLSQKGAPPYAEIQSGLFPTQVHGGTMKENGCVSFTQAFGGTDCDTNKTHGISYPGACAYMYDKIDHRLNAESLSAWDLRFQAQRTLRAEEILHDGSGFVALEDKHEPGFSPDWLTFPEHTLGQEQEVFLSLLETGNIPTLDGKLPLSYICGTKWLQKFREISQSSPTDAALLYYGIAAWEGGFYDEGLHALDKAVQLSEEPIINRTYALMLQKLSRMEEALPYYRAAAQKGSTAQSFAFAKDYLDALNLVGQFEEAFLFYETLPESLKAMEALRLCAATAACETNRFTFLKEQFKTEFASTREGETRLVELWYLMRAKESAERLGLSLSAALETVKREEQPPYTIDFRTYTPDA